MTKGHMLCTRVVRSEQAGVRLEDPLAKGLQQRAFRGGIRQRARIRNVEWVKTTELIGPGFRQQCLNCGRCGLGEATALQHGIEKKRPQGSLVAPHPIQTSSESSRQHLAFDGVSVGAANEGPPWIQVPTQHCSDECSAGEPLLKPGTIQFRCKHPAHQRVSAGRAMPHRQPKAPDHIRDLHELVRQPLAGPVPQTIQQSMSRY